MCLCIIGCSKSLDQNVQSSSPKPFSFDKHNVVIGSATHQTILTGFLLNGETAEIAVVNVDKNNARHLRIYTYNKDKWELTKDTTLQPGVMFVDIVNIDGQDRLITYQNGQLNWFDPEMEAELRLVDISTHFNPLSENNIPQINLAKDLNGDGRDDIVLPDIDGFWISTQLDNGVFTEPLKLGPSDPFLNDAPLDENRSYREIGINSLTYLWYMTRFHLMDYDGDKLNDIVPWNKDHFDVYLQNDDGTYSTVTETFTLEIPFDHDGAYSLAFGYSDENTFKLLSGMRKKTERRVLHMFRDLNNDGIADIVIHTLEGRSLGNLKSFYDVYFGEFKNNKLVFNSDDRLTINTRGKAGGLLPWGYAYQWWEDFDSDGQIDILFKDVKTAIGGMARAMVGKSIAIDLEAYHMQNGTYPLKPTYRHKIRPALEIFQSERVFFPPVLLGDVNGDNRVDILIGKSWNEMYIYHGTPNQEMIENEPQKITIQMPNDERNIRLADMNKDDKKDVLIYYPDDVKAHRVSLLISK